MTTSAHQLKSLSGEMITDTGYMKLCPTCHDRYALEPHMAGKTRDILVKDCRPCFARKLELAKKKQQTLIIV